jgi:APA family basic amino acid/polyamine antiporter
MPELRRELNAWDGVAIVIGITMGAGIFATPGRVDAYLPSFGWVALAWGLAALTAFLGGAVYAELGSRLPQTGGEYIYLQKAYGPLVSFVYGWAQLLVIRTNPGAALSLVAAEYLEYFVPFGPGGRLTVAIAIVAALGFVNYFGLRAGKSVQNLTTILKVSGCVMFIAFAAVAIGGNFANLSTEHVPAQGLGPIGNFTSAMLLTVFTFIGYDRLGFLAGEMQNPERNIHRVLLFGIGSLTVIYFLMILYYHAVMPIDMIAGSRMVTADAAAQVIGPMGVSLIVLTVIVSTIGSTNGTIMTCSRIYYAMARDGLFLSFLGKVHPRYHSPYFSVIAHCVWVVVLLLVGRNLETFIGSLVFIVLISYALMTVALIRIRRMQPRDAQVYRVPGYPWTLALYLAILAVMTATTCYYYPRSALLNLALVGSGVPFYFVWRKRYKGTKAGGTTKV